MRPEVARIDDQNATLYRFHNTISVDIGDVMHIRLDGVCYHFDVLERATIIGCRTDAHPVAERNGALISAFARFTDKCECVSQGRPTVTRMCRTCMGQGSHPNPQGETDECLDCGATGQITE